MSKSLERTAVGRSFLRSQNTNTQENSRVTWTSRLELVAGGKVEVIANLIWLGYRCAYAAAAVLIVVDCCLSVDCVDAHSSATQFHGTQ